MVFTSAQWRVPHFFICLFLLIACQVFTGSAHAEKRAAIVIGNSDYPFAPLSNPQNDAKLIANTLTELNFDVLLFYDLKKEAVKDLKETVRTHLVGADIAVFYYAGHALQASGRNLLLPVDVDTSSAQRVVADALALNDLIDIVKNDPVGLKLFILDACRNNPAANFQGLRQGLADTEAGSGQVLVAYATSAGEVAYDGTGLNSPYSSALANALQRPNLDVYDTFRTVRGDVRQATGNAQIPWITGSIETRFVFRPQAAILTAEAVVPPTETSSPVNIDEVLWTFIKDSPDPADFERFAKIFPQSAHAAEAEEKSRVQVAALSKRGLYIRESLVASSIASQVPSAGASEAKEFVFQQSGERAVSETFRMWPSLLPETAGGMRSLVTECDLYGADPNDPQRQVPGVSNGLVNVRDALRACAFALAADQNNPRLQYQLGRVLEIAGRYNWAEYFYKVAGGHQYSAALVNLGYMARMGIGRKVDYDQALSYYMAAAKMGNLRARTNVGTAYILGQGVSKEPEEGILWYRLAASSGWANAITALGDCYRLGTGVKQDASQAVALYMAAADTGQIDAMANLGQAYISGEGTKKDLGRGLETLLKATDMGNKYAPYYAARLYLKGADKLPADRNRALSLFKLSANRGLELANLDLAFGYDKGSFTGKADVPLAYYYGVLAEKLGVNRADEARAAIGKKLDTATRQKMEAQVDLFLEQNGK
ncbi:caspase family protein [Rhizobium etli]|uniref:Caspase family p20 domain-containing protein n=1 Tax=Rhizobium etli TaxID=29449 RepID=A0A7W6VBN4_RHIET|nr:caspase family protein [Rhizobium etli]MBB4481293.1 hypothetical protein [Rhizobium etli]MBB4537094.1 hypothetical protein [Rhizobium etli]